MRWRMIHLRALFVVCLVLLPGCGIGGWHISIFKNRVPFTATFQNSEGLQLAYRVRLPAYAPGEKPKRPLFVYIDGSGKVPLDLTRDQILAHFQSRGFVAAMKQKRGVTPSEGKFKHLISIIRVCHFWRMPRIRCFSSSVTRTRSTVHSLPGLRSCKRPAERRCHFKSFPIRGMEPLPGPASNCCSQPSITG